MYLLCVQQWKMAFSPAVWGWCVQWERGKRTGEKEVTPTFYCAFFLSNIPWLRLPHSFLFPQLVQWQLLFLLESALGTTFICDVPEKHFSMWNICRCFKGRGKFFWSWTCWCSWVPFILIPWFLSLLQWMFFIICFNERVKKIWPKYLQEFRVIFLLRKLWLVSDLQNEVLPFA